jgi:hypothetical protein
MHSAAVHPSLDHMGNGGWSKMVSDVRLYIDTVDHLKRGLHSVTLQVKGKVPGPTTHI